MDLIKHSHAAEGGLNLHVAEIGQGPKVVRFWHGFPEIWYMWRHQMKAVAEVGYCEIAIDFRPACPLSPSRHMASGRDSDDLTAAR